MSGINIISHSYLAKHFSFLRHLMIFVSVILIVACGGGGSENSGDSPLETDNSSPTIPQNLSVKALSDSQILLTWDSSADDSGIASYTIYSNGSHLSSVEGLAAFDINLGTGITNCYAVSALDAAGNQSGKSEEHCTTTMAARVPKPSVSVGSDHSMAVKSDGTVWTWGDNSWGQLGDGTRHHRSRPVNVEGLADVISILGGSFYTSVLKSDGSVWGWGTNHYGLLGDSVGEKQYSPIENSLIDNVISIKSGSSHMVALKRDGTVWTWGDNKYGQLGDGTSDTRYTPVRSVGMSGVAAIASGYSHTVALKSDGTIWTWGRNNEGQLGNGSTIVKSNTPLRVIGLTGVIAIAADGYMTMALRSDGSVWAWGENASGQLGDGTTTDRNYPAKIKGLSSISTISAGGAIAFAIDQQGAAWFWGSHETLITTPRRVAGFDYVDAIEASGGQVLLIQDDGTAWSWGRNPRGLGDGSTTYSLNPVNVQGTYGDEFTLIVPKDYAPPITPDNLEAKMLSNTKISLSWDPAEDDVGVVGYKIYRDGSHLMTSESTLAIDTGLASGINHCYRVSAVDAAGNESPIGVQTCATTATSFMPKPIVDAGVFHTVALKQDGTVWAWGNNRYAQLGDGSSADRLSPVQVEGLSEIIDVSAGYYHTLALKQDGTVWAWGDNSHGQLGNGDRSLRSSPTEVKGLSGVIAISSGYDHSVALKGDGTVWAWGENESGQLGDGDNVSRLSPVQVKGLGGVISIAAGKDHTVALKNDGTVRSWGGNEFRQLGDGTSYRQLTQVRMIGVTGCDSIAADSHRTVVRQVDNQIVAWGYNLGDGDSYHGKTVFIDEKLKNVINVASGNFHFAVLKNDETVSTWGGNIYGQLGDGSTADSVTPLVLENMSNIGSLATGSYYSVVVKDDDTVWAWGSNSYGQLGDGTTTNRLVPTQVKYEDGSSFSL